MLDIYSIELTNDNWWNQVGEQGDQKGWPGDLTSLLRGLIANTLNNLMTPSSTPHLISLAQLHLNHGIKFTDTNGDRAWEVAVYVPNPVHTSDRRSFFVLIPKYPGGTLKRLSEL